MGKENNIKKPEVSISNPSDVPASSDHIEVEACLDQTTETSFGLPSGFVAKPRVGSFLLFNKDKLINEGGFIYLIAAVVLDVFSAKMMSERYEEVLVGQPVRILGEVYNTRSITRNEI